MFMNVYTRRIEILGNRIRLSERNGCVQQSQLFELLRSGSVSARCFWKKNTSIAASAQLLSPLNAANDIFRSQNEQHFPWISRFCEEFWRNAVVALQAESRNAIGGFLWRLTPRLSNGLIGLTISSLTALVVGWSIGRSVVRHAYRCANTLTRCYTLTRTHPSQRPSRVGFTSTFLTSHESVVLQGMSSRDRAIR